MLKLLASQKGEKILDIGSGSGWAAALLCVIVGESGSLLGLERIDERTLPKKIGTILIPINPRQVAIYSEMI